MTSRTQPVASPAPPPRPGDLPPRPNRLKSELRWITTAWLFGSLWLWTTSGACWTKFAQAIGTPDRDFGIFAALPYLGILAQLPASYYITRYGRRRAIFLFFTTLGRLMWVVLAVIPWVVPGPSARWWELAIFVVLIGQAAMNASGPAWSSWMADVVPRRIRGRYFGWRSCMGQCVGILTTLFIGWLLDRSQLANPRAMLAITSLLLAVAGVAGALDIQCHQFVRDDYPQRSDRRADFWLAIRQALANRDFRNYLAFNFILQLAVGFTGQYVWLYILDVVHMSNKQANMLAVAVPLIAQMLAYPIWGKLVDRVGRKPVLIIAGMVTTFGSVGWLFIGPDAGGASPHWRWMSILGYALVMLTTVAWPGMDMANTNIVLDLLSSRDNNGGGTAYVAILNLAVAVGGALSGFLAYGATQCFPHAWSFAVPLVGVVLTYHGVLFLASTLVRLSGMGYAFKLHEPKAAGTRQAIGLLTDTVYSNVREVMLLPTRMAGIAVKWTNKIDYRSIQRLGNRVVGREDDSDQPRP